MMMKDVPPKPSYKKDLILLFSVPIAVILLAVVVIRVPRLFAHPSYDFIYTRCSSYSCEDRVYVDGSSKVAYRKTNEKYSSGTTELYYYSVADNATRYLTFDEAKTYRLNASSKSPEGYRLTQLNQGGGFLFFDGSDTTWYLQKGLLKKEIQDIQLDRSYDSRGGQFVGWIEK